MTEPVKPARKTPATASKAPAAKPAAAKAPAKPAAAKAPAKPAAAKAPAAKPAAAKAPAAKAAPKAPAAQAEGTKAPAAKASKAPAAKAETKPVPVAEPIKPGKDSWSRLATGNNSSRTVNELLKKAGLAGQNVQPRPVVALAPTGKCTACDVPIGKSHKKDCYVPADTGNEVVDEGDTTVIVETDRWALIRPNKDAPNGFESIGLTQTRRIPVPIDVRAEMLQSVLKDIGGKTGPAGPLWDNSASFASIRKPEPVMVGADAVEMRVVLINSLVSGRPSRIIISPVRVASQTVLPFELERVAPNQFDLTSENDHDERISETSQALDLLNTYTEWFEEMANKLFQQPMNDDQYRAFANKMFPFPGDTVSGHKRARMLKNRAACDLLFAGKVDITAEIKGTKWGALVSACTVLEHLDSSKTVDQMQVDEKGRAMEVLFGRRYLGQTAFRLLWKS